MYTSQAENTSSSTARVSYAESTKYVADILSSMANGGVETPSSYIPNFLVSSGTGLTPTLTPTTLATLEQTFMEANGHSNSRDPATQSGFVPPVVDRSADVSQDSGDYSNSSCSEDWEPRAKVGRMVDVKDVNLIVTANGTINATPQRKYTRRNKDEKLPPEEEERRRVRRERNKVAAAKCRQRRVDHTNVLIEETEVLEEDQRKLEREIAALNAEREQLEFILQAHTPVCKVNPNSVKMSRPAEPARPVEISRPVEVPRPVEMSRPVEMGLPVDISKIKSDPCEMDHYSKGHYIPSSESCPAPENLSIPSRESQNVSPPGSVPHPSERGNGQVSERSSHVSERPTHTPHLTEAFVNSRPNSLPLIKRDRARMLSMAQGTGVSTPTVALATPSSMALTPSSVFCPGLDSMVDGSTGLTPLTGLSSGLTCSSQTRTSGDEKPSDNSGSPTLISL